MGNLIKRLHSLLLRQSPILNSLWATDKTLSRGKTE